MKERSFLKKKMPDKKTDPQAEQSKKRRTKENERNNSHTTGTAGAAVLGAVFVISFLVYAFFSPAGRKTEEAAVPRAFVWEEAPMPWNLAAAVRRCEEARITAWPPPGTVVLNRYDSLSVPTLFTRIGEDYFLVDCYHDQILTSDSPQRPLREWRVMSDQINRGHTIAGDGTVYLADDTENNRVLVYRKINGDFYLSQAFEEVGIRPHYILYDGNDGCFYALSSMTGELYVFRREDAGPRVRLEEILSVPELRGVYVRSFTKDGEDFYFPACDGRILRVCAETMEVAEAWTVPDEIAGLVQVTEISGYFYITVSTDIAGDASAAALIRVRELSDLSEGVWEDVSDLFGTDGTPYYITLVDGHYYLTRHGRQGLWRFDIRDGEPENVEFLQP